MILSAGWFFFACRMVAFFGGETMTWRLKEYFPAGEESFLGVVKTCLTDLGYLLRRVFFADPSGTAAGSEMATFAAGKLQFLLWMLLPVLFAPFLAEKNSVLFLLAPMLVINLMPSWQYQYHVFYQYTFGPAALILFAAILTFSAMKGEKKIFFVSTALVLSLLMSGGLFWLKADKYRGYYAYWKETYSANDEAIDFFFSECFREGDSVSADNLFAAHLTRVDELFSLPKTYYTDWKKTDWYLIDKTGQPGERFPWFLYEEYEQVFSSEKTNLEIWRRIGE